MLASGWSAMEIAQAAVFAWKSGGWALALAILIGMGIRFKWGLREKK